MFKLKLTLQQNGSEVSGTLDLYDNTGHLIVESGNVSGTLSGSGNLTLSGTTYSTDATEPSHTVLSDWTSQLTPDGSMTGSFTQHEFFDNFWGPQQIVERTDLANVRRSN